MSGGSHARGDREGSLSQREEREERGRSFPRSFRERKELRVTHKHCVELWMEPGRFLVATAGVLLAAVTQTKEKGGVRYVGVDAGFNSLLRYSDPTFSHSHIAGFSVDG